jgi:hypothetical protein
MTNCRVCHQGQIVIKIVNVITQDVVDKLARNEHLGFYQAIDMTDSQMLRVVCLQSVHVLAIAPISPSHIRPARHKLRPTFCGHPTVRVGPAITPTDVWSWCYAPHLGSRSFLLLRDKGQQGEIKS